LSGSLDRDIGQIADHRRARAWTSVARAAGKPSYNCLQGPSTRRLPARGETAAQDRFQSREVRTSRVRQRKPVWSTQKGRDEAIARKESHSAGRKDEESRPPTRAAEPSNGCLRGRGIHVAVGLRPRDRTERSDADGLRIRRQSAIRAYCARFASLIGAAPGSPMREAIEREAGSSPHP
jgi:hypothetical protein